MTSTLDNSFLLSNQDTNWFFKQRLNPRCFIQPSETLSVELPETHILKKFSHAFKRNIKNSQKN